MMRFIWPWSKFHELSKRNHEQRILLNEARKREREHRDEIHSLRAKLRAAVKQEKPVYQYLSELIEDVANKDSLYDRRGLLRRE